MKRYFIIGDIHGCYAELLDLLDKAGLAADDDIISIGDIVDRGLDSGQALALFRAAPNARALMGNHEWKHVLWSQGKIEPAASQIITRHQIGSADYPAACAYMARLPASLELPDAALVHAFYEPGVPLADQQRRVLVGTLSGEQYLKDRGLWPWYAYYDGDKPLIVGHRDYSGGQMRPFVYQERVYALDSRCCYGGALTGLLLPDFRLISVPSRGDHWGTVQRRYAHLLPPAAPPDDTPGAR